MTAMHDIRYLRNLGCCPRCVLVYCGVHEPHHFSTPEAVSAATKALMPLDSLNEHKLQNNDTDSLSTHTDAVNSVVTTGNTHSSHLDILEDGGTDIPNSDLSTFKDVICVSCLGLLQDTGCSEKAIKKVLDIPRLRGYDAPAFSFSISLPVCLAVRTSSIAAHYSCHVENVDAKMLMLVPALKDAWKAAVSPVASSLVGRPCNAGEAPLSVTVSAQYSEDDQECAALWAAVGRSVPTVSRYRGRRPAPYSYHNNGSVLCSGSPASKYSRQAVQGLLDTLQPAELAAQLPLPSPATTPLSLHSGSTARGLVYVAGRYRKLSRQLSQTPWVLNGLLKCHSSVEETIAEPLLQLLGATGLKFLSAGREDVDVRCLGRGRPFALELTDAHVVEVSDEALHHAARRIAATGDVQVTDLQLVDRESTAPLRHNMESKAKTYCALCMVRCCIVTEQMLECLNCAAPLTIQQQTPLRVLHRRPLLTRPRTVHSMSAQHLRDSFFKVTMRTEAGAYIKEFVHGDFGRTRPSLTTLLGCDVDILALDVLDVELDWPPTVTCN